jgi:transcription initiation factor TFIIIB Brf1 subunit/transcription initiation factor TFIIB
MEDEDSGEEPDPKDEVKESIDSILPPDAPPEKLLDIGDLDLNAPGEFCSHQSVSKEKGMIICDNCGTELYEEISHEQDWRYFKGDDSRNSSDPARCQYRKSPEKGIKEELKGLGFPPNVCEEANKQYAIVTQGEIKRSDLRKGIIFACTLESYKILKKPKTVEDLQEKFFGKNKCKRLISQGINYFRLRCPREHFQHDDISAKEYIPQYMAKFNAKREHVDLVVRLFEKIKDSCPVIMRSNPQSTSKALVFYYLRLKGCPITATRFGRIVALSDGIIQRLSGEISRVLGTQDKVSLA